MSDSARISCAILRVIYTLCLNKEPEIGHFLLHENGIGLLKFIFEKIGKKGQFNNEFVKYLFDILELPTVLSFHLNGIVPLLLKEIVFNARIWSNSPYLVQKRLLERAGELLKQINDLPFNEDEPYCSILLMLYDYFAPEEVEEKEPKDFLESARKELKGMLLDSLKDKGNEKVMPTLVKFLLLGPNHCYSIRDLLRVIILYQGSSRVVWDKIAIQHIKDTLKAKTREFDIIMALHMTIVYTTKEKLLLYRTSNEDPKVVKARIDCCEDVIAYSVFVLLSFYWDNLWINVGKGFSSDILKKNFQGGTKSTSFLMSNSVVDKTQAVLEYLAPGKTKSKFITEYNILLFLFHKLNEKASYSNSNVKEYLGEKTYLAVLAHLSPDSSMFYKDKNMIQNTLLKMNASEWDTPKNQALYGLLLERIEAFELSVQELILLDCNALLANEGCRLVLVKSKKVFSSICEYLLSTQYTSTVKKSLEHIYLTLLLHHWSEKKKLVFWNKGNINIEQFLYLINDFLDILFHNGISFGNSEHMYSILQLLYYIEDIVNGLVLDKIVFLHVIAKIIIYLNELKMLYFWYPPCCSSMTFKASHVNLNELFQREGGVIRIVLKFLLKSIIHSNQHKVEEDYKRLVLKLLSFFIYRKQKTLATILKILNLPINIKNTDQISFVEASIKDCIPSLVVKAISRDKTITQQKLVDDVIKSTKKDLLSINKYRTILLYTELVQVLIYLVFDVSSYTSLVPNMQIKINKAVEYVSKILGKIGFLCIEKYGKKCGIEINKWFDINDKKHTKLYTIRSLTKCFTNVDECSEERLDDLHVMTESVVQIGKEQKILGDEEKDVIDNVISLPELQENIVRAFNELYKLIIELKERRISNENYTKQLINLIITDTNLKIIQPALHKFITDKYLQIEKAIIYTQQKQLNLNKETLIEDNYKRTENLYNLIQGYNSEILRLSAGITSYSKANKTKKEYEKLSKKVLSEFFFSVPNKVDEKVFEIAGKYYKKLLNRSEINKEDSKLGFKSFIKLDMAKDNIGRAMRLKRIKQPLENIAVLKRIVYIRQFFLKKVFIAYILKQVLDDFFVPDKYWHLLLKALIEKLIVSAPIPERKPNDSSLIFSSIRRTSNPGAHVIKTCVTRGQLARECKVLSRPEKVTFIAEMIKIDHSIFGNLLISNKDISFTRRIKDNSEEYRLGPTAFMNSYTNKKVKKVWRYNDITKITTRHYNHIPQAIELHFINRKSILLVLFSEENVTNFFSYISSLISSTSKYKKLLLIEDTKKLFSAKKFTTEWRKKRLTNFEYLMVLNEYANRSFHSLAQYPVFPWVIGNFNTFQLSNGELRNLKLPIAALTQRKQDAAIKKYENTDDFPGGRFLFGTHYLPGRAVLGYLLRLEPYTTMTYRFDSGGDCPSRHFHSIEMLWEQVKVECDNNLELIPEFYYLTEFLANQ